MKCKKESIPTLSWQIMNFPHWKHIHFQHSFKAGFTTYKSQPLLAQETSYNNLNKYLSNGCMFPESHRPATTLITPNVFSDNTHYSILSLLYIKF